MLYNSQNMPLEPCSAISACFVCLGLSMDREAFVSNRPFHVELVLDDIFLKIYMSNSFAQVELIKIHRIVLIKIIAYKVFTISFEPHNNPVIF